MGSIPRGTAIDSMEPEQHAVPDAMGAEMLLTGLSPSMISIPPDIVIDGTGQQRDAALDSGEAEVVPADSLPSPMPTPPETAIDSRQQSQDVLRKALEEGELPADLFTADHHWLSVLLSKADISMTIKAAIEEFQHRYVLILSLQSTGTNSTTAFKHKSSRSPPLMSWPSAKTRSDNPGIHTVLLLISFGTNILKLSRRATIS